MDKVMFLKLFYGAWLTSIALQIVLGAVLVYKQMWRQFPIFTFYSLFSLFQSALGFAIRLKPQAAAYLFFCCETIGFMLGLGVVYEVFNRLLTPYPALSKVASTAAKVTIVGLLLVAAAVVLFHAPVQGSRLVAGFVVLEQATRIAEVGLIVFLFSFSSVFGLHWRQGIFGMALGLGVFVSVELVGITLRAHYGNVAMPVFAITRSLSFNFSLLIWLGYILAPERVTIAAALPKRVQLEQWNQAVMELIHQ
jgi:hypothetical protein